jgi:hypothetical protein
MFSILKTGQKKPVQCINQLSANPASIFTDDSDCAFIQDNEVYDQIFAMMSQQLNNHSNFNITVFII